MKAFDFLSRQSLVLASASPRRNEILGYLQIPFSVRPADFDELSVSLPSVYDTIVAIAKNKLMCAAHHEEFTIAADTEVILDNRMLGKPDSESGAIKMLHSLSGVTHEVVTAVALSFPDGRLFSFCTITNVTFSEIPEKEILRYASTPAPYDKAGGYGVQDYFGACFIKKVDGCFYNVMGFPLNDFIYQIEKYISE